MVKVMKLGAESYETVLPLADVTAAIPGELFLNEQSFPVQLRFASKYSLSLMPLPTKPDIATGRYDALTIYLSNDDQVETGSCQVYQDNTADGHELRLVSLKGIVDFQKLLFKKRVDLLDNAGRNLPLVLGYKKNLDRRFKEYVSELSYDLSVYQNLFDRLDEEYMHEPSAVREIIQKGIIENMGSDFTACLDTYVRRLPEAISNLANDQYGHHGYYLRKQIWRALLSAPFLSRTNLKPRGYIGDSEMMQMCYRHDYEGASTFGKIMHYHPVNSAAAQAVRNRRAIVPQLARNVMDRLSDSVNGRVKLLSVACGPAVELNELYATATDCQRLHCSLLDQDQIALTEAAASVRAIETRFNQSVSVDMIQESVRTLLATRILKSRWGDFHFIYSMGLFDYLTPPVAAAVLEKLYALLLPGGEMAIGNFHVDNPTRFYMDYWMDWPLYYRTEETFLALTAELKGMHAWIDYDDTGVQMLLRIRKTDH
ncbi:MAG: class I SAM-dependent methyltransferase [Natronospirillum sp.]